jgi:hypothetical protein
MRTRHIEHEHPLDKRLAKEAARLRNAAKVMKPGATRQQSWCRLSEQNLRVDKWSVCRG